MHDPVGKEVAPRKLRVLDLFSGIIGGFSLGLERTGGFETVAFCEIDPFCQRVLAKHWPSIPCYPDVTTLRGEDVGTVDVICGGFPCQDISVAGLGAGLDGARSGLWSEYARLVGELRPDLVLVENVSALLGRGLDRVLGDLVALGYDAEWHCIPASAVGAPHRRDRIWIVAYPNSARCSQPNASGELQGRAKTIGPSEALANAQRIGQPRSGEYVDAIGPAKITPRQAINAIDGRFRSLWSTEPDVGRVAHGVPNRVDRLKSLGNAVVPQIPELIGRAILESLA